MRELEKHTLSLQLLILKVELQRERAGEIQRSAIYGVHLPRGHNRWNRYRPELGASSRTFRGWMEPKDSHHPLLLSQSPFQGVGSEVEQAGLELASRGCWHHR